MKYKAKVIIATGQFMNVTVDIEIDTDDIEKSKDTIRALHKHFYGLLDPHTQEDLKGER